MSFRACFFCELPAVLVAGGLLAFSFGAAAQSAPVRGQTTVPVHPTNPTAHPHQEPCWQVAGISKAAMEQRRAIMQGVRSQVEAVCADSSLTAKQRNEKIREIHQQAKQQADAIVTPHQQEAMKSCQLSRGGGHPTGGGGHPAGGGGGGPCGQLPTASGSGNPGSRNSGSGNPENSPSNKPENDLEN